MTNWERVKQEAVIHLQNLIRINTTNPPGNELEAVRYVASVLEKDGIEFQIFESAPGRGNLVARYKGSGTRRPLLLTSHVDVVPAEKQYWKHDPFSGVIDDGCVWGRGAVDMKQMVVMELMMLLLAKREKVSLARDLIYAVVADEEAGGKWGSEWLVNQKPHLLDAEYGLNEVGGFGLSVNGQTFYPIGVAEKGVCWFKIISRGDPGHGSIPHGNQAVVKLAEGVARLGRADLPFHGHPVAKKFVATLAGGESGAKKWIMKMVTHPWLNRWLLSKAGDQKKARSLYALFHNTLSPTVVRGGEKTNVIPSLAYAEVDGRIIPGQTVEKFLQEVKKVLGEGMEMEIMGAWDPVEHSHDNDFFELLKKMIKKHDPEGIPVPYLMPGFTDAAHYHKLGIKTYGFAPVSLPVDMNFSELFHAHNERIPVAGFLWGLKVLWDVVQSA